MHHPCENELLISFFSALPSKINMNELSTRPPVQSERSWKDILSSTFQLRAMVLEMNTNRCSESIRLFLKEGSWFGGQGMVGKANPSIDVVITDFFGKW